MITTYSQIEGLAFFTIKDSVGKSEWMKKRLSNVSICLDSSMEKYEKWMEKEFESTEEVIIYKK